MSFQQTGPGGLEYFPCHYGGSALQFRGPARPVAKPYLCCLGGAETFGRFLPSPWPSLLEQHCGLPVLNLGLPRAGPDTWLGDPALRRLLARARATVIQVTGAESLSNRFYAVHPRRNDRFLRATPLLRGLYPEVDFAAYHFTRPLLRDLARLCPRRFAMLRRDLQATWRLRMDQLTALAVGPVLLLWLAEGPPGSAPGAPPDFDLDPLFVTETMLAGLTARGMPLLRCTPSHAERAQAIAGKFFTQLEAPMAARSLPLATQVRAAEALQAPLARLLAEKPPRRAR